MPLSVGVSSTRPLPRALPSERHARARKTQADAARRFRTARYCASKRALIMPTPTVTSARYWFGRGRFERVTAGDDLGERVRIEQHGKNRFGRRGQIDGALRGQRLAAGRLGFAAGASRNSGRDGSGSSIPISAITFEGVSGRRMSSTPSASATAFAMHGGVLMLLPSPSPFAPSGVTPTEPVEGNT